jgi:hypothetical protein
MRSDHVKPKTEREEGGQTSVMAVQTEAGDGENMHSEQTRADDPETNKVNRPLGGFQPFAQGPSDET